MDLKQLKYFMAVAEEGTITAAAQRLHISQPPLSTQIKLLEQELGVKLMERGSRQIILTDEGKILYKRARNITDLVDTTEKELDDCHSGHAGMIHFGTVSTSGAVITSEKVLAFHRRYPQIRFEIREGNTFELIDMINSGIIELAIIRTPFNGENLRQRYLPSEPLVALMKKEFDWCPDQKKIALDSLVGRPLIYHRRFEVRFENICRERGIEPHVVCKSNDVRTAVLCASAGFGVALIPKIVLHYAKGSDMVYKEIDEPTLFSRLCAVWLPQRRLSFAAQEFLNALGGTEEPEIHPGK